MNGTGTACTGTSRFGGKPNTRTSRSPPVTQCTGLVRRWLEYFFSASLMMLILGNACWACARSGSLQAQIGCMATVILFGWITDFDFVAIYCEDAKIVV